MTSRVWESTANSPPRPLFASELAGFLILIVAFLTTVFRLDSDQLVPASCLALGLTGAVVTVSHVSRKLPAVLLGGFAGSLGLFLAVKALALILAWLCLVNLSEGPFSLPRVVPGSLVFGLEGLVVGAAVNTLVQTSEHLRLSFGVIIFVVWGAFFVAYAYWLC
jgi:hypothetical protein